MLVLWKNINLKLFLGFNFKELNLDVGGKGKRAMYPESFKSLAEYTSKLPVSGSSNHGERDEEVVEGQKDIQMSNSTELHAKEITSNLDWKPLERDLYLKGVEVFGKNRYETSQI